MATNPLDPTSAGWTVAQTGDMEQGSTPPSGPSSLVVPPGAINPTSGTAGAAFPAACVVKILANGATISSVKVNGGTELYPTLDNISVPANGKLTVSYSNGTPTVIPKQWATIKGINDTPSTVGPYGWFSIGGGAN